jgi:GT2 family glycosyltransferase
MDVSVIIINYNTKDLTIDCIKSIFDSKTKYSYEVIVVDNASSDGSVEAIKHLFPQVTTIVNKVNVGFGRANNQAAAITTGRYLYLINSDTVIDANVIDRVVCY